MYLQELCAAKLGWDQTVPDDPLKKRYFLSSSLSEAQPIIIPQHYLDELSDVISATLCMFCDTSLKAQAAVVYLHSGD